MTRAWEAGRAEQHDWEAVCVSSKEAGLWQHNALLCSGCIVGKLLTSGCFLRESEKHRKSRLACECVLELSGSVMEN